MRIYTCVFEQSGAIKMADVSAPWDRAPADEAVEEELELSENDRLIALVPGQHTKRAWIFENKSSKSGNAAASAKKIHSGISLKDYVPNGF